MDEAISYNQLQKVSEECVGSGARQLSRLLTRFYDKALAPSGLKLTQFSILTVVALHKTVTIMQLAAAQKIEHTTLTRNIALLQCQGYVVVEAGEQDARTRHVRLTPKGEGALTEALPRWEQAQQRVCTFPDVQKQIRYVESILAKG